LCKRHAEDEQEVVKTLTPRWFKDDAQEEVFSNSISATEFLRGAKDVLQMNKRLLNDCLPNGTEREERERKIITRDKELVQQGQRKCEGILG